MPKRKRRLYPTQDVTDLTDAQWAAIAPIVITTSSKGGRPTEIDLRAIINAFVSKDRTGCQWRPFPADVSLAHKEYHRNPESNESFLYPVSTAMLLNRLYPRSQFLIMLS
jgi:transposase